MTRRFLACAITGAGACLAIFTVLVAGCGPQEPLRHPAPASSPAPTESPAPDTSASSAPPDQASPPPASPPGGTPSPQPNGATLIVFAQIRTGSNNVAGDVTDPGKLDPFLTGQADIDQQLRAAADRYRRAGTRLLAFRLNGCHESGATLVIESDRVAAKPTGGENYNCFVPEYYVALFAVPASLIPAGAKIGWAP
jgi:hypothetical protein